MFWPQVWPYKISCCLCSSFSIPFPQFWCQSFFHIQSFTFQEHVCVSHMYLLLMSSHICNTAPLFIGIKHEQVSNNNPTVSHSSPVFFLPCHLLPSLLLWNPAALFHAQLPCGPFVPPQTFPNLKAAPLSLPTPLFLSTNIHCTSDSNHCYL